MKNTSLCGLILLIMAGSINNAHAQTPYFDAGAYEGYGFRFWNGNDNYKISMGNSAEYTYGPVTGYSIKTNMYGLTGWGFTWGSYGTTPVAALTAQGNMQIAGALTTGGRIGIGTASPTGTLHIVSSRASVVAQNTNAADWSFLRVQGSGSNLWDIAQFGNNDFLEFRPNGGDPNRVVIKQSGNVGIGTITPTSRLVVAGAATIEEAVTNFTNLSDQDFHVRISTAGAATKRTIIGPSTLNRLSLGVGVIGNNEYLTIINGGNVGIGTTSPDQKLTVNGTVHATRVKVDATVPTPDYVFEKSYALATLDEVKSYIDENKHLPEIPSAKEMEAKGIDVGEMNMLLLKKVEELTLYVIELKKELDEVKQLSESNTHR
jgi:hypothetical protein